MYRIAVFASGSGTNAENLIRHFNLEGEGKFAQVALVVCNKSDAFVLTRANNLKVPAVVMKKAGLCMAEERIHPDITEVLRENRIDVILLAGYLLQIPKELIELYPDRIINIHPALLPSYGGKGMYGHKVHQALIADMKKYQEENPNSPKDFYSGITVHLVDEEMDHGKILFQSKFILDPNESVESLEEKIHVQEQADYPRVAEAYLRGL
ncbi:MAG: phosphoribosylglycinamide formyltransferase [Bacteroidales bacterium]|nr:phosphoribosylglycinamide formyltransferase [Bacteroidales bacterium]